MSDLVLPKSDHLLLIIGTSPLPNYVAACLLTQPGAMIYLLHSRQTMQIANHLNAVLSKVRPDLHISLHEIERESDRLLIEKTTEKVLSPILVSPDVALGLNYTGGTKPMATHIYRTVKEKRPGAIFTYLDARSLKMWVDGEGTAQSVGYPIARQVKISFENLAALHGRVLGSIQSCADILFPEVCKKLIDLVVEDAEGWRNWCNRNLRTMKKLPQGWKEKVASLLPSDLIPAEKAENAARELLLWAGSADEEDKKRLPQVVLPDSGPIAVPFAAFSSGMPVRTLGDLFSQLNQQIPKIERLSEWLDGKWLEHYVLDSLNQIRADCELECNDLAMNLVMVVQNKTEAKVNTFANYGEETGKLAG